MTPDNDDPMRNTRTTHANWLMRAFVAPYFVNYHLEHHLLMAVPCYNLPRAHEILLRKGYGPKMETQRGYAAVLALATSKPRTIANASRRLIPIPSPVRGGRVRVEDNMPRGCLSRGVSSIQRNLVPHPPRSEAHRPPPKNGGGNFKFSRPDGAFRDELFIAR